MSKTSRLRKRAKKRLFENSAAGKRKRLRQVINHLRHCPESGQWWFSNDPGWAPEIKCQNCHLRYTPDTTKDEIIVPRLGRFPANPSVLDLMVIKDYSKPDPGKMSPSGSHQ